jgi:hypothetical protein
MWLDPDQFLSVPIEKSKIGKRTSKNPKMLPNFHNPSPKEPFTMKLGERKINKKSIAPKVRKNSSLSRGDEWQLSANKNKKGRTKRKNPP